jgi:hypothetical protein
MDLKGLGLGPSSSRVRVGRNLSSFPLPGAMTKEQRCEMEEVMSTVRVWERCKEGVCVREMEGGWEFVGCP